MLIFRTPKRVQKSIKNRRNFQHHFSSILASNMAPKSSKNRAQEALGCLLERKLLFQCYFWPMFYHFWPLLDSFFIAVGLAFVTLPCLASFVFSSAEKRAYRRWTLFFRASGLLDFIVLCFFLGTRTHLKCTFTFVLHMMVFFFDFGLQKEAKNLQKYTPRSLQQPLGTQLCFKMNFGTIFEQFWPPTWTQHGT